MISVITNRGALAFMVFQGKFQTPVFIEFMKRLLRQVEGKLYLIVDGHPVHRSAAAKRFAVDNADRLRLIRLPGYCPELNPDELLNQDVKTNALGKSRPTNKAEMIARAHPPASAPEAAPSDQKFVPRKTCSLRRLNKITHYLPAPSVSHRR